ncbi:MAG: hypothetical protein HY361_04800 [Candidatus Aenigmarchaeota archaeon]|nr:hypothetical protein [Candidatus Aenigmarchaeota archaeon]
MNLGIWKGFLELLDKSGNLEIRFDTPPTINNYYYLTVNNRVIKVTESEFKEHIKNNKLIGDWR